MHLESVPVNPSMRLRNYRIKKIISLGGLPPPPGPHEGTIRDQIKNIEVRRIFEFLNLISDSRRFFFLNLIEGLTRFRHRSPARDGRGAEAPQPAFRSCVLRFVLRERLLGLAVM